LQKYSNYLQFGKFAVGVLALCLLLSACNTSNFNDGVSPQSSVSRSPIPAQGVGTQTSQTNQTALTPQQPETPVVSATSQITGGEPISGQPIETQVASLPQGDKITFLPVTGAPQFAVTRLSAAIKRSAAENSIALVPTTISGAKYRVKGYFSALDDGSGTLLVYVWDVLDANGKRAHRISGQERTAKRAGDPWAVITELELKRVAEVTMARLNTWLRSK